MCTKCLRKAAELTPSVRAAFESVLGRHLCDDQTVSINAYATRAAPTGMARDAGHRRLFEFGDKLAKRVVGTPEKEMDASITVASISE